jgi:hypothetical protein
VKRRKSNAIEVIDMYLTLDLMQLSLDEVLEDSDAEVETLVVYCGRKMKWLKVESIWRS